AADGHADVLAAKLWARLIFATGERLKRPEDALAMRPAAEAAVRRAGRDAESEAALSDNIGTALRSSGKFAESIPYTERARELREHALGRDHPDGAITLINLANGLSSLDRGKEAQAMQTRALAIFERVLGPEHPNVATVLNNLGGVYYEAGDLE